MLFRFCGEDRQVLRFSAADKGWAAAEVRDGPRGAAAEPSSG